MDTNTFEHLHFKLVHEENIKIILQILKLHSEGRIKQITIECQNKSKASFEIQNKSYL